VSHTPTDSKRSRKRTAAIILPIVLVALAGSVAYNFWHARRYDVKPVKRTLSDFIVTWRCLACGHTLSDRGGLEPRTCPQCGRTEMYISIRHACPTHGVFPVAFEYDETGEATRIKVADGDWVRAVDDEGNWNTRCPQCGAIMLPAETSRPAPREPTPAGR
jgi:predicted RNA-binding Zn-ribbon protein involved in translation (DUF1610 family)